MGSGNFCYDIGFLNLIIDYDTFPKVFLRERVIMIYFICVQNDLDISLRVVDREWALMGMHHQISLPPTMSHR